MRPLIVVADGCDDEIFEKLKQHSSFDVHPKAKLGQEEITALLPQMNGLVIRSATNPDAAFLKAAKNLKLIIRAGEGTDNIDKKTAQELGIKVANTPGANNNSAAEHALALMLTVLRNTARAHQSMTAGQWNKNAFTGLELWKKRIGIVGFGRIGQLLAQRLSGFEPEVLFFDPQVPSTDLSYARKVDSLEELFSSCDIVSLHTPLLDQTRNMIGAKLLSLLSKNAILINASRGGIVDEVALLEALKNNRFRGAGFDVFAKEPLDENSPLRKLDNLVLTPHLGASTEEAQKRVGEMTYQQLVQFFDEDKLVNEVRA